VQSVKLIDFLINRRFRSGPHVRADCLTPSVRVFKCLAQAHSNDNTGRCREGVRPFDTEPYFLTIALRHRNRVHICISKSNYHKVSCLGENNTQGTSPPWVNKQGNCRICLCKGTSRAGLHNSESSKGQIDQHKLAAGRKSLFRRSVEEILKGRSRAFAIFSATEFSRAGRKDLAGRMWPAGRMLCRPALGDCSMNVIAELTL